MNNNVKVKIICTYQKDNSVYRHEDAVNEYLENNTDKEIIDIKFVISDISYCSMIIYRHKE